MSITIDLGNGPVQVGDARARALLVDLQRQLGNVGQGNSAATDGGGSVGQAWRRLLAALRLAEEARAAVAVIAKSEGMTLELLLAQRREEALAAVRAASDAYTEARIRQIAQRLGATVDVESPVHQLDLQIGAHKLTVWAGAVSRLPWEELGPPNVSSEPGIHPAPLRIPYHCIGGVPDNEGLTFAFLFRFEPAQGLDVEWRCGLIGESNDLEYALKASLGSLPQDSVHEAFRRAVAECSPASEFGGCVADAEDVDG